MKGIRKTSEKLKTHKFKEGTFPVSIDVVGLCPNIPHEEGLSALRNALEKREDKSVPTDLLVENNIFEY